jgi:hypothetical protein
VKNLDVYESNQQKLNRIMLYVKEEVSKKRNRESIEKIDRAVKNLTTASISMSIARLQDTLKICNEFIHDIYSDE